MTTTELERTRSIQQRARRMWRDAGRPKGREADYLERAQELQVFVDHPAAGLLPNPMSAPAHGAIVEEAELLENLGEFPGRTDQGDRPPAPMTRRMAREFLRQS
ncbi:MAG: DUF2934 domain-containing protein [Acetobacteraceae bacterium]